MDFDPVLDAARRLVDDGSTPACQVAVAHDGEIVVLRDVRRRDERHPLLRVLRDEADRRVGRVDPDRRRPARPEPAGRALHPRVRDERQGGRHRRAGDAPHLGLPERADGSRSKAATRSRASSASPSGRSSGSPARASSTTRSSAHWVLAELIERLSGDDFRDFIERARLRTERPAAPARAAAARNRTTSPRRPARHGARRFDRSRRRRPDEPRQRPTCAPRACPAAAGS